MCLQDQGIDKNNGGVGIVRQARGLRNDNRGVRRGRGIDNTSDGLETTTEAAGARKRAQGIYNNDKSVGGGR